MHLHYFIIPPILSMDPNIAIAEIKNGIVGSAGGPPPLPNGVTFLLSELRDGIVGGPLAPVPGANGVTSILNQLNASVNRLHSSDPANKTLSISQKIATLPLPGAFANRVLPLIQCTPAEGDAIVAKAQYLLTNRLQTRRAQFLALDDTAVLDPTEEARVMSEMKQVLTTIDFQYGQIGARRRILAQWSNISSKFSDLSRSSASGSSGGSSYFSTDGTAMSEMACALANLFAVVTFFLNASDILYLRALYNTEYYDSRSSNPDSKYADNAAYFDMVACVFCMCDWLLVDFGISQCHPSAKKSLFWQVIFTLATICVISVRIAMTPLGGSSASSTDAAVGIVSLVSAYVNILFSGVSVYLDAGQ